MIWNEVPCLSKAGKIVSLNRSVPAFKNLKKAMEEGAVGATGVFHFYRYVPKRNHDDLFKDLDLARWLLGEAKSVYAKIRQVQDVCYALVTLRLLNGSIVNIQTVAGMTDEPMQRIELAGNFGIIRYDSEAAINFELVKKTKQIPTQFERVRESVLIKRDVAPEYSAAPEELNKIVKLTEATIHSAHTGLPVHLKIDE